MESVSEVSPISELSSCMRSLLSQDSPRRRLALTPELHRPERQKLPEQPPQTPTVNRRRGQSKILPPEQPSLKMRRRRRARCLREDLEDDEDDEIEKENTRKRVRVRLFSKSSPGPEEETVNRNKTQSHHTPEKGRVLQSETETLDSTSVKLFQRLRSRKKSTQRQIPDTAITDQHLIGDFSKQHVLPIESVDHQELHCISAQTVAALLSGQFSSMVEDFLIIDCRYPYEYQGGHIKGAVNLYMETQIRQAFLHSFTTFQSSPGAQSDAHSPERPSVVGMQGLGRAEGKDGVSSPRKLIVFHCEFSSERGPRLCQYLRELDRTVNAQSYPLLFYPELYLLHGGYKQFYTSYPDLCEPCDYVPMRHQDFREQLRRFSRKKLLYHRRRPIRQQQRTAHS